MSGEAVHLHAVVKDRFDAAVDGAQFCINTDTAVAEHLVPFWKAPCALHRVSFTCRNHVLVNHTSRHFIHLLNSKIVRFAVGHRENRKEERGQRTSLGNATTDGKPRGDGIHKVYTSSS